MKYSLYELLYEDIDKFKEEEKDKKENEKEKEKTGVPKVIKGTEKSNIKSKPINPTTYNSIFKQKLVGLTLQGQEDNNYVLRPLVLNKQISDIKDLNNLEVNQNSSYRYNNMGIFPFFIFDDNKILSIRDRKDNEYILLFYIATPGALIDDDNEKMMNGIFKVKKEENKNANEETFDTEKDKKELIVKPSIETIGFCPILVSEIANIQSIFNTDSENKFLLLVKNLKSSRVIKNVGDKNITKDGYILNPYQIKYILNVLVKNLQIRFANQSKEVYKISQNKL